MGSYALVFAILLVLALALPAGTSRRTARRNAKIAKRNDEIAEALAQSTVKPPKPVTPDDL